MWKCKYTMFIENISQNYFGLFENVFVSFLRFLFYHARNFRTVWKEKKEKHETCFHIHYIGDHPNNPLASLVLWNDVKIFFICCYFSSLLHMLFIVDKVLISWHMWKLVISQKQNFLSASVVTLNTYNLVPIIIFSSHIIHLHKID